MESTRNSIARISSLTVITVLAALGALLVPQPAAAYEQYSIDGDATNCASCHGDFRNSQYTSLSDGQAWGNLHNIHRQDMLGGDCVACHQGDTFPVLIGNSFGGDGLAAIGCVGCHGRAEDGTGTGTLGYGLAMKQRHHVLNVGGDQLGQRCIDCHAEADPSVRTPVGEHVLPPYYANPGNGHPDIPSDPCNPSPDFVENFAGTTAGIDNDGDLSADEGDSDCGAAVAPGETSGAGLAPMLVTARDSQSGTLTVQYNPPCSSTDHNIEFGDLGNVSAYDYAGQECSIGTTGSYVWTYPTTPGSLYFVIVAQDGVAEGSYGTDSGDTERPEDIVNATCPLPQNLTDRCD